MCFKCIKIISASVNLMMNEENLTEFSTENFTTTIRPSLLEIINNFSNETNWKDSTDEFFSNSSSLNGTNPISFQNDSLLYGNESRGGGVVLNSEIYQTDANLISNDDAAWILTATFIIFTMQTGFGLLEAGCISMKNESNIMIKNVVDIVFGGFTYWLFGYGLSFGKSEWTNPFCGWGDFALNANEENMGIVYTTFFFQLSFATTATTIVSGAVAERFSFLSYIVFSAVNTIVYCIPASWIWNSHGFLYNLGVIDIAGSCAVHLCGGVSALVAAYMVGPRLGRYDDGEDSLPMGSPTSALLGMFMLWWGWLGFNCGSTFGIRGHKWKYAARTAVMTLQASIGGGLTGMSISWYLNNRMMKIPDVVNSILGALVSVTAGCALYTTWESFIVGMVGGVLAILNMPLMDKLHIDDPVGAVSVHGVCGLWAMIATGLFVGKDPYLKLTKGRSGLFKGGGFYLLGIQCLACICTIMWSMVVTFLLLKGIDRFILPIRMSEWEELVGADFAEHGIRRKLVGISRAVSVLGFEHEGRDYTKFPPLGDNPCHEVVLDRVKNLRSRRPSTITKAVEMVLKKANEFRKPSITINGEGPLKENENKFEQPRYRFSRRNSINIQNNLAKTEITLIDLEDENNGVY